MALAVLRKSPSSSPHPLRSTRVILLISFAVFLVPLALRLSSSNHFDWLHSNSLDSPLEAKEGPEEKETFVPPVHIPAPTFVARPEDQCHVIGANPDLTKLWTYNSRILCMSSSVCFRSRDPFSTFMHSSDLSATQCVVNTPNFVPLPSSKTSRYDWKNCSDLQREKVLCAFGPGLGMNQPRCPTIKPVAGVNLTNPSQTKWIEDISIVLPAYPYPNNIYHHGNSIAWFSSVADGIPSLLRRWGLGNIHAPGGKSLYFPDGQVRIRKLNLVFLGVRSTFQWQRTLLDIMLRHRLSRDGVNVTLHYLRPARESRPHTCVRNAAVLGLRGHVNVWFFPNSSSLRVDGTSVPSDAVEFKRTVYKALGMQVTLPSRHGKMVSELPPLTVGYSRRAGTAEVGRAVHLTSSVRVFSKEDETWFTNMLREETTKAKVRLHIYTTSQEETLEHQVRNVEQIGFVVGIHGANLVNAIFMHPFGALLEIMPYGSNSKCYVAGSNSGLAYFRHIATQQATPQESGCTKENRECQTAARQRRVKIGSQVDRDRIRSHVQKGIQHLRNLHEWYPGGVPVRYTERTGSFDIPPKP